MNPSIEDKRQPLPSLLTVYRPIEEYWESSRPAVGFGPEPSEALDPFDAFLVHRLLELLPGLPVLIDAAMTRTGGASSLIGLAHPHVRGVWAIREESSLASERALAALRDHVRSRGPGLSPFEVIGRAELTSRLAEERGVVILADARDEDAASLMEEVGLWLDERPDAVVLVLGLGRVGECPALASMVPACAPGSGKRLRLVRELGEVLMASRLGLITRDDHPSIAAVLDRLQGFYTGNYAFLDLLRQVNLAALREARIDVDVLKSHPTFWPVSEEIEGLKRSAREAKEQAAEASRALAGRGSELEQLREELRAAREQLAALPPALVGHLIRLRHKLAPTPIGKAWRLGKRVRCRLSPTPLGRAWRLARRVARACLGGGR